MTKKIILLTLSIIFLTACTFAGDSSGLSQNFPGFVMGLWHGLVAPFTLIVRFFIDIKMYANPAGSLGYDIGFLLGLLGAVPIGWLATIVSILVFFFA
jgi:hypothetical protein